MINKSTINSEAIQEERPLITIVGVLGKQGLSAARTLLQSGKFRVRGITRRIDSPEAVLLSQQGAELVSIPLDLGHKEAFVKAFRGSDGVFLMTPNIAPPATHEYALGKELADAAVEAQVPHVVFSSLENVDKLTGGKKFAPHFTDKGNVEAYIRTLPIKSSFIIMAFFYTNLMEFYTPIADGDTLVFPIYLPKDFRAPFVDPLTATGPAVLEIFSNPDQYAGQSLPVIGDIISPQEMVETFVKVTGKKAVYSSAYSREELLSHFPAFGANETLVQELTGMVEYAVEYGYYQQDRDLTWSRRINPESLNWEQFLRSTGWEGQKQSY
ncbi:NmrA/HSCARG family protein [Pseudoflavitalea sp. G-6-1-2]|uniref:NmrA/HSCARG family protein n=1 Tax=Pseudoflavitalea sp. G-6-1-2 TaxID=2728841 RepID=UPI00146E0D0C|nr:NmrA/HSCARG family protein [Pseudoflavitalea sp. G-6-1-2]NML22020.1 NmrA/HSCARG family protein [Pseudoflavitalea sp. G-6-1-2]